VESQKIDIKNSNNSIVGQIHSVETFGALDGPGIRYVVFLQGCFLKCIYCHNPDSWSCEAGTPRTAREVMGDILRYKSFISKGGVTISGGEPLIQPDFCHELIIRGQQNGLHMAIDTSGYSPLSVCKDAVEKADLLLLDIKALDDELCRKITGESNKNALAILDFREKISKPVWIRHVMVPGVTLKEELLIDLADYLKKYTCVERVELLPFHKMGEYKWEQMNRDYTLKDTAVPTNKEIQMAYRIFKERGLPIVKKF